jgi:predicted TIM-barrel fold metal-dependent hydrolase
MSNGVTDIHIHIQPWEMLREEIRRSWTRSQKGFETLERYAKDPAAFVAMLDEAGIERAGIINYSSPDIMGFTDGVNEFVSKFTRNHRDRLIPFGSVHPRFTKNPAAEMDRLAGDLGIRGIKIHPPHQLVTPNAYRTEGMKELEIIYGKAQEHGLPVMIHTGTSTFPAARNVYADPMPVDDVAVDFPDLKIILAHGGRPLYMQSCFFLLRRHPNVYLDISSIPPKNLLGYFPRLEEIAAKTLFGTDWPGPGVPHPSKNLSAFRQLPLSNEARDHILSGTARHLFP